MSRVVVGDVGRVVVDDVGRVVVGVLIRIGGVCDSTTPEESIGNSRTLVASVGLLTFKLFDLKRLAGTLLAL